ncbi:MAG: LD-carboxypeptidase [Pelomonas sp.]|nr:LD-carboxypeptidase [Roseateles sp.]
MTARTVAIPALAPGARLAIVAPAGPPRPGQLEQVVPTLEAYGWSARVYPGCAGPPHLEHLAASDAQRLADLHAAFADPTVDALLCLRGGWGAQRLLPHVDAALLRAHPKPLIGFSDITSLHALRDGLGIPGWHGPMAASNLLGAVSAPEAERLFALMRRGAGPGLVLAPDLPEHALSQGSLARGRLIGGNLAVFTALCGTPWALDARDAILFFEEVDEAPYRVDRLLTQLAQCGVLDAAAGFLVGDFSGGAYPTAVLADHLCRRGKPVLAGWPSGHCVPNWPLPLGLDVELDVAARCLRF